MARVLTLLLSATSTSDCRTTERVRKPGRPRWIAPGPPRPSPDSPPAPSSASAPPGSGSDYTAFVDHLGIASLNTGFRGEGSTSGGYHSDYDTCDHVVKFEDPDFQYMPATVQLGGRLTLRTQPEKRNQLIQSGALRLAADPRQTFIAPKPLDPVPFLNFAPLENALTKLQASSNAFAALDLSQLPPEKAKALDQILMRAERVLTREEGLPRRPWFHHMIYAPGYYTGYGVKTLPGIREALEQRYWMEADQQIGRTAAALGSFAAEVNRAVALTTN